MKKEMSKSSFTLCFIFIISIKFSNAYSGGNHTRAKREIDLSESGMTTPMLIQKYGYPSELHTTMTKDGYILELHRIPYGVKSPPCRRGKKTPVLLMHDIISSSSDWIINGPEKSLGYLLADDGYDVWMGNVRGNRYSRNHREKSPSATNFWDFSLQEMGAGDLPAIIDYILQKTGQPKLLYLGHSMGNTLYYILLSEHPQYNNKIIAAFQMSPVVYLNNMKSMILNVLAIFSNFWALLFDVLGVGEFLPRWELLNQLGRFWCKAPDATHSICQHVLFALAGFNHVNIDWQRYPIYIGHTPAGASFRTFVHYGQIRTSGQFGKFNKGIIGNFLQYNSYKSPAYNLQANTNPIYMFYADDDWFSPTADVNTLYKMLPANTAVKIEVQDPRFAHVDFIFGINAKAMVYDNLLPLMRKHKLT